MTDTTTARFGFFPVVAADEVSLTQAGSSAVLSAGDVEMHRAGSNFVAAGGNVSVREGGALAMASTGDIHIEQGGAVAMAAAGGITLREGFVGVALAPKLDLSDAEVMVGPVQAAAFGAGLGLVLLLVRLVFGRR